MDEYRGAIHALNDQALAASLEPDALACAQSLFEAANSYADVLARHGMPRSIVTGNVAGAVTTFLVEHGRF